MFDGTLGECIGWNYNKEVKEDTKPYHTKPFSIPNIHKPTL